MFTCQNNAKGRDSKYFYSVARLHNFKCYNLCSQSGLFVKTLKVLPEDDFYVSRVNDKMLGFSYSQFTLQFSQKDFGSE